MPAAATQSTFEAAGAAAALIDEVSIVLYVGCALIFVVVMGLVAYAVVRRSPDAPSRVWILGGGVAVPTLVLAALLVYALQVGNAISMDADCVMTVRITAKRWWWEVRYVQPGGEIVSANELHLPAGARVKVLLDTDDVIHSFWVPALAGKVDMIPGRLNHLVLEASRPGVYRAQCAEFCGAQHAFMALNVIVHEGDGFARWLERETEPAAAAADDSAGRGATIFASAGCASCHTVRGTSAEGTDGPDLTHVASRSTLGAGVAEMSRGTIAGWISNSQALKPGNLMPPIRVSTDELHALTTYVAGLK
jgi:cytochrome c oxidase subunit 2